MKLFAMVLQATFLYGHVEATWMERKAEGWAWYEDPSQVKIDSTPPEKTAEEKISEVKKILEEKLAEALINPTEDNVATYMIEQKKWLQQSTLFAHIWGRVLLKNPELDPTAISYPVTQYGIQLQKEIDNEKNRHFITTLSKKNGLFFFYEGASRISQGLAKVLKKFSEKYNWQVIAISVDGEILEEFSDSKQDNGIAKHMNISILPALLVVNPKEKDVVPVAYGFVSLDQIEEKILLQFKK